MSSGPSVKPAPGIKILVLEGRMQVNRLADGIFATPVVEVRNSNDMPIEGAKVTISLPGGNGAGAAYADGSLEKTFTTNSQGQVMAEGYTPNNVEGKFSVRIRAEYGADRVEIVIPQANSMVPQAEATRKTPLWRKKWLWISAAAVAGGVTAIVLTRGDSSSKPGVITVTPGPPVIGVR